MAPPLRTHRARRKAGPCRSSGASRRPSSRQPTRSGTRNGGSASSPGPAARPCRCRDRRPTAGVGPSVERDQHADRLVGVVPDGVRSLRALAGSRRRRPAAARAPRPGLAQRRLGRRSRAATPRTAVLVVVRERPLAGLRARTRSRRASRRRPSRPDAARRATLKPGRSRSRSSSPSKRLKDSTRPILPSCASRSQSPSPRAGARGGRTGRRRTARRRRARTRPQPRRPRARRDEGGGGTGLGPRVRRLPRLPSRDLVLQLLRVRAARRGRRARTGRVVAVFTVYQPRGWRTSRGLALGDSGSRVRSFYGRSAASSAAATRR